MKRIIESEKTTKIREKPLQYWEVGLSFYYIPMSQIIPQSVVHPDIVQAATIFSLELGKIKGLWKKLTESEKVTTISEQPLKQWEMRLSFFILYSKIPKHPTEWHTPIPIKQPKFGLWSLKILEVFERYP